MYLIYISSHKTRRLFGFLQCLIETVDDYTVSSHGILTPCYKISHTILDNKWEWLISPIITPTKAHREPINDRGLFPGQYHSRKSGTQAVPSNPSGNRQMLSLLVEILNYK